MTNRIKNMGGIYTPKHIANYMLDLIGYNNTAILNKRIMENSCGDGAFLCEIVRRYCNNFLSIANFDKTQLKMDLENHIFGIEKDAAEYSKCIKNLNSVSKEFGVSGVQWSIVCGDALEHNEFDNKMDFVIGNPPYVRVHNLENYDAVKNFQFTQSGMTDLYIAFFELGFNQLNENGKMCLITPNSFLTSKSGAELRKYIQRNKNLDTIID
jgi:adenine-specific DNA-methyltransferase